MTAYDSRRAYLQRVRKRLWRKNPHCYYCGRVTVLPPRGNSPSHLFPDMATIEHLVSRHQATGDRDSQLVLSCWQCNNNRARAEQQTASAHRRRYGFLRKNVTD